ncbi:hypothetical protein AMAG_11386 [Allomyces macrogynus ATCC 38327]|uniref:SGTA homodimerisation domain-containing protein n=1 Tax=Allomyces macrogynus (strain ATCC 38327) TaxID=578462 RepID=A0A0L0SWM5_ALLM3|nr:hypothetical protein AMAG_11386 [Allomyces macrogynus ATCC 38327]|eukprot:KNE66912.1 hypothetical protein AMAG_11386 [Allomyces macrogynus ATCC 38327]
MDEKTKRLAFAVLEFLQATHASDKVADDEKESLDVAMQCLQDVFKVDLDDAEQQALFSMKPASLMSVFDVYLKTKAASDAKARAVPAAAVAAASAAPRNVSDEDKKRAEELKAQGNKLVAERKFPEAVAKYTDAIALNPNNAVYFSNRAAAYSQAGQHDNAIDDAKQAAVVDPTFSKAYSRLGHAYYATAGFQESARRVLKVSSSTRRTKTMRQAMLQDKAKLPAVTEPASDDEDDSLDATPRAAPGSRGMPDLGALGGAGGLAGLLNNPNLMQMAQQMMANNPGLARMAQQMMGGGAGGASGAAPGGAGGAGGAPNIAELMNNPAMMEMAAQAMSNPDVMNNLAGLMGNRGGAGGPGGN